MDKSKIFFITSLIFLFGVFGASFFYPDFFFATFARFVLLLAVMIFFVFYKNKQALIVCLILCSFAFGFWLTQRKLDKIISFSKAEEKLNFSKTGVIVAEPKMKENKQQLIFSSEELDYKILIQESAYQKYFYGEELELQCELEKPQNKEGSDFDYAMYLARDDIFYLCQKPHIQKTGKNLGNQFYRIILQLKNKLSEKIAKIIPAPESGLLEGILIGGDDKLSEEVQNNFSRTGMTHIVAVSGYNITIVAQYLMIMGIFLGLWRRQAFWFALVGIWIFILLTGFPSSAIRAGTMGTLLLYAMRNGRLGNATNAILCSAVVMLMWNPLLLRYDIGFQLSFLATLGIVYCYSIFNNFLIKRHEKISAPVAFILEILFMSLSAQVLVLPIILFNFQTLSLISPLANILVLPLLPLAMLFGFVALSISFIFPPLTMIFAWVAYLPLHYVIFIIKFLAELKYSAIEVALSWRGVVFWYIILLGVVYYFKKNKN